ncbi:hypothetical protein, partial [Treponema sp. C6A8]|uniref:hypothetical protein n=1 Tax=Treponema sp. C6A8 TaxID=1410609 RepID=UPI0005719026
MEKVIMDCVVLGNPYPVLNEKRELECFIDIEALKIVRLEKGLSESKKKLCLRIADGSIWLHFKKTSANNRFTVSGTLSGKT